MCVIMLRFIVGIRELYDRDLRKRWQGIDTGFGVFSQLVASSNATVSVITFADASPDQGHWTAECSTDDSETIQLEMVGDGARQV